MHTAAAVLQCSLARSLSRHLELFAFSRVTDRARRDCHLCKRGELQYRHKRELQWLLHFDKIPALSHDKHTDEKVLLRADTLLGDMLFDARDEVRLPPRQRQAVLPQVLLQHRHREFGEATSVRGLLPVDAASGPCCAARPGAFALPRSRAALRLGNSRRSRGRGRLPELGLQLLHLFLGVGSAQ